MKKWFTEHKECFVLGLSMDGTRETHNNNRSNSFDKIDFDFFKTNWSNQGIKMTLTEYSLLHLAENIKYIHSLGFHIIKGVNLAEGEYDWSDDKFIKILVPQLKELVDFYVENDTLPLDQMLDRRLDYCEAIKKEKKKWCGIGTGCPFFDVDGTMYPCAFITPMTFSQEKLDKIMSTDFTKDENFVDEECYNNCYIYPICPTCSGANYLCNNTFKIKDKRRCKIQKLVTLFVADLQARRIEKNPKTYDDNTLYYMIEAIKRIRELYLSEFERYL